MPPAPQPAENPPLESHASAPSHTPSRRSQCGLDGLNFFLADVRDGVGPFLGIYLLTRFDWSAGQIGLAMSAMTFAIFSSRRRHTRF